MYLADLEIDIDGYSGPFDALCSLVDKGKINAADIKISQLIKFYGDYLITTKKAPPDTLADFFYRSAGLLLAKTRSLRPNSESLELENLPAQDELTKSFKRYMMFQEAAEKLTDLLEAHSKSFRREIPQVIQRKEREIVIDSSGAYLLAKTWKELNENYTHELQERLEFSEAVDNANWDGFAETDQEQIDEKISELENLLRENNSLSFNELCRSRNNCVTTLLALLELCRLGRAEFSQKELFADVRISAKN